MVSEYHKTEGLYSTPQAVYMNTHWFPHPAPLESMQLNMLTVMRTL